MLGRWLLKVHGHADFDANEGADFLARKGAETTILEAATNVNITISGLYIAVDRITKMVAEKVAKLANLKKYHLDILEKLCKYT